MYYTKRHFLITLAAAAAAVACSSSDSENSLDKTEHELRRCNSGSMSGSGGHRNTGSLCW